MRGNRVSILRGSRHVVAAIIVFSIFTNLLVLTLPLYMLQLFDRVMGSGSMETLAALTLAATGALIVYACFEALRTQLLNRLGIRVETSLGEWVLNATMARVRRGDSRSAQGIRDLHEVRNFLSGSGFTTIMDAPWAPIFVIVIFLFHPYLGMIAAVGAAILFSLGLLSNYLSREPMQEASEHREKAMRRAETLVRNSDVVRAMGMTPTVLDRWRTENDEHLVPISRATDRIGITGAVGKFVRMILQIALLATGVVLALQDAITPGVMIAASIMMGRALAPVERAVAGWKSLVSARYAARRLRELLSDFADQQDLVALPEPEARITCENLTFWLQGSDKPIIYNINFSLEPGEAMGIIGPSGAGKSTLARVLVGLDDPTRGSVRLDGADLRDWEAVTRGQYFGYLPQQVQLFTGTVADNISGLDNWANPGDIVEAAKRAGVHDMILKLPGGYNADIGDDGNLLSAGQRQRLALARSLYRGRRIIVLDEPNSNLDPDGEDRLAEAVEEAKARGCALILITHRLSILSRMDKVLLLKDGMQAAIGPANEILLQVQESQRREKVIGPQKLSVIGSDQSASAGAA